MELLRSLKEAEAEVGRELGRRYGPREIDVDLIAYGNLRYRFSEGEATILEVPHHLVAERRFVLQPLFDIASDWELPGLGQVRSLLVRTNSQAESVQKVADAFLPVFSDRS
jgi:7,8-dihydro-6-hydroxymethylpterin-pyrophosphokinase